MTESEMQKRLISWCDSMSSEFPELGLIFHVANGGHRHVSVASMLKAEGVKAGVPDLILPVPIDEFHGLFLEMKTESGSVSEHQKYWLSELGKQGYCVWVAYSLEEAKRVILDYLNGVAFSIQQIDYKAYRKDEGRIHVVDTYHMKALCNKRLEIDKDILRDGFIEEGEACGSCKRVFDAKIIE